MTLLLQTDSHVRARKARRCAARMLALQATLEEAMAETEADIQAGAFRAASEAPLATASSAVLAGAASAPMPGMPAGPAGGAEAAAAFASATAAAADAAGLSEEEHIRFSNEIYVPTQSISDALVGQIRERSKAEARHAMSSLAAKLKSRARRAPDDDLVVDSLLEELRKLVPSEFLVAWAAWTTASDLISPSRMTDAVRWAVWVIYTISAFVYVLWQLFEARREEECRDCLMADTDDDFDEQTSGDVYAMRSESLLPESSPGWTPGGTFMSRALRPIESNGFHSARTDSSAVSLFQFIYEEHWHRAPLLGILGTERSDAHVGGTDFRSAHSTRGARSTAAAAAAARRASPSDVWLCLQALVSATAFMLLTAATGDVYLKPNFMLWAVLAVLPLFPLFAQVVLSRGMRRRRR